MARQKQPTKAKEPVKIRFKKLANGNQSIYLDCYKDGKREYEFLKLYLIPETTPFDKKQNEATLNAANAIKAQRVIELANGEAGLKSTDKAKMLLADWLGTYKDSKTGKTATVIGSVAKLLVEFSGEKTRLMDIDKKYCLRFIDFLKSEYKTQQGATLKPNTIAHYCNVFNTALNVARKKELITHNPFLDIDKENKVKTTQPQRAYLTADELKRLMETDCHNPAIKQAFLFSCFCGLRVSDVKALKWRNVVTDGKQTRVDITVQKTKKALNIPLPKAAVNYLPDRGTAADEQPVFELPMFDAITKNLKRWAQAANISKNVTFHTARHTFATLLLTKDVNLAFIQKLLGHSRIQTTQIYADIIDNKLIEATNTLNEL